jgi:hypothetical protein
MKHIEVAMAALAHVVVFGATGCNGGSCDSPTAATYSCPAQVPDGGVACMGSPHFPGVAGEDASYAVGCTATLPLCGSGSSPSTPVRCTCLTQPGSASPDAALWSCPM